MSTLNVNTITPNSGTTITIGGSGDTITVPSGTTLSAASGSTIDVTNATKTGFPQGGLRHITTVTNTSDSSSIDIPGCFSSTYKNYRVVMNNVTPVTDSTSVYLNFGNSDLSTIRDGYQWALGMYPAGFTTNQPYSENVSSGSAGIKLTHNSSNNLLYGVNMVIDVFNPYSSSTYTAFSGHGQVFNNAGNWGNIYIFTGSVRVSPGTQDESLRITAASGNMDGNTLCSVSVYGYAES